MVVSHACFMAINRKVYHLFAQDGWNVELVAPVTLNFPSGKKEAEPQSKGDPLIHYLNLIGDNPRTYYFKGLETLLFEKKPGIVLLDNDPVSQMALNVGKWCKKNNAKLFCISNENLPLDIFSSIKRRGWKNLPATIAKRILLFKTKKVVDGIFTINNEGKQIFRTEGYKQVEKTPLGFDPSYFYPDNQTRETLRTKLKLTKPVIAYFGRLTKEKGIHILIKALEGLKEQEWILMMDGFDEYASGYTKEIHQLLKDGGIMKRVVFISPSHYEIGGYMNTADIVVIPSVSAPHWKEQYGRVAAEAMACGKLVVASDSGALPQLIDKFGILFPEGDIKALKTILLNILTESTSEYAIHSSNSIADYAKERLSVNQQKSIMIESFNKAKLDNN
ncbi:MAG: glycosyltransferase [Bacteroidia bacterium]